MSLMDIFVKIGADTSGLEDGVKKSEGLASSLGKGFGNAMKVAGAAVGAATTAVGAFAVSAVKAGASFDSSMAQVAATMGKTVDEIGELRDFAQQMGSTTAFSATQAADALNYMALAGYDAETSMKMLPNVLNLAAAGNMELATASDMVTDAQTALGLSLEETEKLVDMMAKASSKSNTSVSQLGEAILTVGGTAKTLSGGTNELNTALGVLADNGIKGSEGGTKLRNAILSLSSPTDDAAAALEGLGVQTKDAQGNLRPLKDIMGELSQSLDGLGTAERAEVISSIFNKTDIGAVNALLDTSAERWNELSNEIDNSAGAADKMAKTQLDNLAGDITLFKSALEGAQIAISDELTPSLRDFVQFGSDGLSKITQAFKEGGLTGAMGAFGDVLSDGLTMIIDKIPAFIDAGMQLLGALGKGLIDNLPKITDAAVNIVEQLTKGLAKALPALAKGAVQVVKGLADGLAKAAPTLIPIAIQAILDVVKALLESAPQLEQAAWNLLQGLADGILNAIPVLINMIPQLLNTFIEQIVTRIPIVVDGAIKLINGIVQALPTIIEALVNAMPLVIDGVVKGLIKALPALIQGCIQLTLALVAALPQIISALVNAIPMIINTLVQTIMGYASTIIAVVGQILEQIGASLIQKGAEFIKNVGQTMSEILNTVVRWLSQLPEKMAYWAGYAIGSFIKFVMELPSKVSDIFTTVMSRVISFGNTFSNKARETAKTFLNNMVNGIKNLPTNLWNIFTTAISKATELASTLASKASEAARNFTNNLVSGVSSLPSKFSQIGSQIVNGLWSGIKDGWGWLKDKVSDLADSLFQGAKDALGIHSPSRKFMWVGQMIDEGLAKGIDKFSYVVDGSLGNLGVLDYVNSIDGTPQLALAGGYGGGDYNQTVNIYSPTALTPSEVARQTRNATRDMVLELRGKR